MFAPRKTLVFEQAKSSILPTFGESSTRSAFGAFIIGQTQASCTDGLQAPPWASLCGAFVSE